MLTAARNAHLPPLEERTLFHAFERALAHNPDKPAQADADSRYSYAQVHARALTFAGALRHQGVNRGDSVLFMLDNHLDAIHLWFAMSLTGVVEVPINTAYKGALLTHLVNDSGASTLVIEAHYLHRIAPLLTDLPLLQTLIVRGANHTDSPPPQWRGRTISLDEALTAPAASPIAVGPDELMACMYTSGTTGASKGAELSHAHAYTHASREDMALPPGTDDRMLVALPIFHLGGQGYGILQSLIHQSAVYLIPRFSLSGFWPLVRSENITGTVLLGTMAELLWQDRRRPDDDDNPLRYAYIAPGPSELQQFEQRFDVKAIPVYGSTEWGCPISGSRDQTAHQGEAGIARGNYDLRIIDTAGHDVPDGEPGELLVRPHLPHTIFSGYRNLPEKTAETIRDGWVHTGDILRRDHEGHYYFADRIKDTPRRSGENISSFEVEAAINRHPAVFESAVVAVPAELGEDEVKATIVLRDDCTLAHTDMITFLQDELPYFMIPRYIEFIDEMPRTPTMKIEKTRLRASGTTSSWDRVLAGVTIDRVR